MRLIQMDFEMSAPIEGEVEKAMIAIAKDIAEEKGLIWKIWTENNETGEGGGIYLFETQEDVDRYVAKHKARLAKFGVDKMNVKVFDVNEKLTKIDRGFLG